MNMGRERQTHLPRRRKAVIHAEECILPETVPRIKESTVRGEGHHVVEATVEAAETTAETAEVESTADSEEPTAATVAEATTREVGETSGANVGE